MVFDYARFDHTTSSDVFEYRMAAAKSDVLPTQHHATWRRAALLMLLTFGLAALATSDIMHAALIDLLTASDVVIAGHPILGAVLFVAFAAVSAMLAFVSVALVVPAAVFIWGEPLTILLLWIGWILGGGFSYYVGRFLGRAVVRWLTAEALLQRLEGSVGPKTPFGLVLLFQLALPSEIPGYVLGLVRYSFPKYLFALALVELLYSVAVVHLGAGFVAGHAGIVLATGAAMVAFYMLRRRMSWAARGSP
jgi:uncharacterized membrane protein YdjX (TVP38/TMEM64 family)